jgi:hypothetical protein
MFSMFGDPDCQIEIGRAMAQNLPIRYHGQPGYAQSGCPEQILIVDGCF